MRFSRPKVYWSRDVSRLNFWSLGLDMLFLPPSKNLPAVEKSAPPLRIDRHQNSAVSHINDRAARERIRTIDVG